MGNLGSIPSTTYDLLSPSEVMHECRARNKSCALPSVTPKPKKVPKSMRLCLCAMKQELCNRDTSFLAILPACSAVKWPSCSTSRLIRQEVVNCSNHSTNTMGVTIKKRAWIGSRKSPDCNVFSQKQPCVCYFASGKFASKSGHLCDACALRKGLSHVGRHKA